MERNQGQTIRHEVIQRYCPRHGDNVIMLRTFGESPRLQCMNFDLCDCDKDAFCDGAEGRETPVSG
jgi:hypothetical protein